MFRTGTVSILIRTLFTLISRETVKMGEEGSWIFFLRTVKRIRTDIIRQEVCSTKAVGTNKGTNGK
jgi:hypothetical protein